MKNKVAETIEVSVIKRLKDARVAQGLSYEDLAERTGLHRTAISLIERGKRRPSLFVCLKIALALNIKPSTLFTS